MRIVSVVSQRDQPIERLETSLSLRPGYSRRLQEVEDSARLEALANELIGAEMRNTNGLPQAPGITAGLGK